MDNNMNRPPVNGGGDKNQRKNTIATIVITLIVALIFTMISSSLISSATKKEITYRQFVQLLDQDKVKDVVFDSNKIYIELKADENALIKRTYWTTQIEDTELINDLKNKYTDVNFKAEATSASTGIPNAFPYAGSSTKAFKKHPINAINSVPAIIPITALFLLFFFW